MRTSALVAAMFAAVAIGHTSTSGQKATEWPIQVGGEESPAGPESAQPQLTVSGRGVLLSWVERNGPEAALKFSERIGSRWTPAATVASGKDWFVNWADVPSVVRLDNGMLVAHWLQKSGPGTYAYDVRLAHSRDDGKTWSQSFTPHRDGTKTEHGFATMFQMPGRAFGLVWLDGRNMTGGHEGHGDMTLRFATFGSDWKPRAEAELDARVCECCPTAAAMTADGLIVAYRDRTDGEVRDISLTRLENGKWTAPTTIHADGWRVPACPVNGPALSARNRQVVAGWFTARDDKPKSLAAFSSDAGRSFGAPMRLDEEASLGRVDVELLRDGSAAAGYIEFANQKAEFRVRRIQPDGSKSAPVTVSTLVGNRSSGYPRMAVADNGLIFAWTDRDGKTSQVRTAAARH